MAGRPAVEDVLPLSPMQEGMVFHALYDEGTRDLYTGQLVIRLEGPVDGARMSLAVTALLARHANLRAAFRTSRSGRPVQVVRSAVAVPWQVTDLSALPPEEREQAFDRMLEEDRDERFDLSRPPLLRFRLVTFGEGHHRLLISSHHLLWDGWSAPVLVRELFQLYTSGGDAAALPRVRPYRDYLAWLSRQDREAAREAWRAALHGLDEPSLIAPEARDRPVEQPERLVLELSAEETSALADAARAHGVTVSTVLQGLWAVLLGRLTGRTDVVLGATVSGRDADVPGVETMVGLFINTLPVRVRLRPEEPLAGLLTRMQTEQAALLDHRHLGLAEIQRAAGHTALFDTLLVFESYPIDDDGIARAFGPDGPRMTGVSVRDATHYPLAVTALPGDRMTLTFSHQPTAPSRGTVGRVATRLRSLLKEFTQDPTRPVARLSTDEPPAQHSTARPLPHPTVRALYEDQAARTPDAPAVLHGDTTLTFAELGARADRLAAALTARGAGPESVVAVALPRRPDLVTALLAALKAGAAVMPVDPGYPPDRIALMLDDAEPRLVICDPRTAQLLGIKEELVCSPDAETASAVQQRPPLSPEHPAYVIFTSGSTGRPKGVIGTQRALANRLHWGREPGGRRAGDGSPGVRVSKSPLSFIDGLTELLGALTAGEAVALADDEAAGDPTALAALADRHRATVLTAVPSLYTTLVESSPPDAFSSVRTWISSGETLPGELAEAVTRRWPQARLVNLYGCSEAAGDSLVHVHDGGEGPVPLGRPIAGTRVHVLDPFLRPSPIGAVGELYLAGDGLARGYLNQPGRTAERFVADPFGPPGSRLYRTGDLARLRPDGTVEFLGRADDQVKIRGYRVEPGEIEAVIRTLPGVARAAVVAREDGSAPRRLVAYVVADPGAALDPPALRRTLAERLPGHLVPSAVVVLEQLPRTPSGKLDRRALPAPDFTETSTYEPPRTEPEKVLCGLFAEVLDLERVGAHDDFFERGGDSIVSVRLADRARRAGLALSPRDVFAHRTPAALAGALPAETGPAPEEFTPTGAPLVSLSPSQLDNVKARWRTR
ncbi:amino acid adenylation domain-containing protein [Streptomyces sp. DT2A-34]|uniref:amino acid adenylation domain-containing protein n=1 Tax=Streptomyces sp. DT2A-34 TaxID=3051182 RepID=UPI00265C5923|nr:amino acid adenylation domain-containing protein [Streptomyces sp. DT2A-34]MDO0917222.1 amino acid adenylation domain-containing protein [Streptomyces sp. DT2A-34]